MKAFIIFSIVWYVIAAIVNLLSFGIAVGEDDREKGIPALIRLCGYTFFLIVAICALAWG
jgi:hypothetical protein